MMVPASEREREQRAVIAGLRARVRELTHICNLVGLDPATDDLDHGGVPMSDYARLLERTLQLTQFIEDNSLVPPPMPALAGGGGEPAPEGGEVPSEPAPTEPAPTEPPPSEPA